MSSEDRPARAGGPSPCGRWITFEGIEGCGKSTQIERLERRLREAGLRVRTTREPGGTPLGRRLRDLLLRPETTPMHPMTELLLYTADRAQHIVEVVRPALEDGHWVLCDRFLDATLAYQGFGRGLGLETVLEIHRRAPLDLRPHRTLLLDLPVPTALERARRRNRELGVARTAGRFEDEELAFHERVRRGYLKLAAAEPRRFRVVEAVGAADEVEHDVWRAVRDLLASPAAKRGNR